jgi:hypothetical protein
MTTAGLHLETLVRDDAVRREIYRDPQVFALEMERIFKRTWVFMAHESELAAGGDYLTMRSGAEPVVLVRGEERQVLPLPVPRVDVPQRRAACRPALPGTAER